MVSTRATSRGNHRQLMWHATAYVARFVHVIFRNHSASWAHLPYVLVRKTQFGVYPFRFMCIVYIAYIGVDSKGKLYTFCTLCLRVLFTFHVYPTRSSRSGPDNMGPKRA